MRCMVSHSKKLFIASERHESGPDQAFFWSAPSVPEPARSWPGRTGRTDIQPDVGQEIGALQAANRKPRVEIFEREVPV